MKAHRAPTIDLKICVLDCSAHPLLHYVSDFNLINTKCTADVRKADWLLG